MATLTIPRQLESTADFEALVAKYKAFRLLSLKLSPESFGSTHARELEFSHDTWVSRVSNPLATNIVGLAKQDEARASSGPNTESHRLLSAEWLAALTLMGPYDRETTMASFENYHDSVPEAIKKLGVERHFILNGIYVHPRARRMGLGVGVVEEAKKAAHDLAEGHAYKMILIVDFENGAAKRTYEKCGFALVQTYWFEDYREGQSARTEAAVMVA